MICRAEASDGEASITLGHRIVMRAAFQNAGVVFAVEDGIPIVKLRKPECAGCRDGRPGRGLAERKGAAPKDGPKVREEGFTFGRYG